MVFGIGAFTHGTIQILKRHGAKVSCYLTRDYGHYGPSLEGNTYTTHEYPNPCKLIIEKKIDAIIPMSINWHYAEWTQQLLSLNVPIFSPIGDGMLIERDRDFARRLCKRQGIPVPKSASVRNRIEALDFLTKHPKPYVIKNPLCSPSSPIHTIVCESVGDTEQWLERIDYAEGVFLQEYMGSREAGHIAIISNGEIFSLVTNQEYKRAFDGNMGPVAGAPLGGLIERDEDDKYGLAEKLLRPLLPWFREVKFNGPIQVTAVKRGNTWYPIEYNVRTGVTAGPMILRMLDNPVEVLQATFQNKSISASFKPDHTFGCSLTLVG